MRLAAVVWLVFALRRVAGPAALIAALLLASAPPAQADRWYAEPPLLGIVDAGRQVTAARQAGASWDRALFLWQEIQPNGPNDWLLDRYVDQVAIRPSLNGSLPLVGVVQGTPVWAATDWHDGAASVPTGLDLPVDDPRNTFGQFMLRLARAYKSRISTWILWNEPDFLPGESGTWWTWSGSPADFYKLLRTGYRAIKQVDPKATVVFPATTYFADAVRGRELFLARVLAEGEKDREAPANGYYFDTLAVNLYCSLDAVYRVYGVFSAILTRYQLSKPIWLTETNCPVYNDASTPVPASGRITTDEQAAYLVQSVALARAAGYQRIGWYSMIDHDPNSGILDRWGLLRPNGTPRPAFRAYQVAARYLAGAHVIATLAPLGSVSADGWPVTRVLLDDPADRSRVQVLWRTASGPPSVRVDAVGSSAQTVDIVGGTRPASRVDASWEVPLPPPRVAQPFDPPGFQSVGYPVLLVESGLPAGQILQPARVTSPLMALAPATLEAPRPVEAARPVAAPPPPPPAVPARTQPGPTLVLSVGNPQPNDLVPRGRLVMQGLAFDRSAPQGTGVDKVSVFLDDRDAGGQHLGDATLGQPNAGGFSVSADFSRASGKHALFVYARSSVTGREAVLSFPINVGTR
jgi:hypothetical protein